MITRIGLHNFKAFKKVEVPITHLNLFTGLNGMGKSTLIQSLLLLRQSYHHINLLSFRENYELALKGEIVDLGKGKDIYSIHAESDFVRFEVDINRKKFIDLRYEFVAESDMLPLVQSRKGPLGLLIDPKASCLFGDSFTYLKAERINPEHTYKANLFDVLQRRFLGYRGENTALYIALYKLEKLKLRSVQHIDAKSNNLIANVDAWMNEISPGTHVISTYFNEVDVVKLSYQFEYGEDVTPMFSPLNVGFGFTYILPVITAILTAKKNDLIIIENPESHLHPKGQVKLGELFAKAANDGVQLIIETHSDHILNGVRLAIKKQYVNTEKVSVCFFERGRNLDEHNSIVVLPKIDKDGRIDKWPSDFFDQWENTLINLI